MEGAMLAPVNLDERFEHEIHFPMTQQEFLEWEDEDIHAEWVNGEVTVFMAATARHQLIVGFLSTLLGLYIRLFELGQLFVAPYSMRTVTGGPVREPDLIYVEKAHAGRIKHLFLEGPADLVVEIISDTSVTRDRADKFYEYQGAGIREYLLIDPRPGKQRVDYYAFDENGSYESVAPDRDGKYQSRVVKGFWFRKEWLLDENPPDPLRILMELAPEAVRDVLDKED
jgi:Uma2 family endonuclease